MNRPCALTEFEAAFTATPPAGHPAPFLLADGRIDVTPDNVGERAHVAAANDFKRRLREGADPRGLDQRRAAG